MKKTRSQRDKAKLLKWLSEIGVTVVEHDPQWFITHEYSEDNSGYSPCPFNSYMGVYFDRFEIHCTHHTSWPNLLHEAGHLVATTVKPDDSDELIFFGWEVAVIDYFKLCMESWYDDNREYGINWLGHSDLRDLPYRSRRFYEFLGTIRETAFKWKLIRYDDDKPMLLRDPRKDPRLSPKQPTL